MKNLIGCITVLAILSFAKSPTPFSAKGIEKSFGKIREHIYVSKYEVSNADYRAFLAAAEADPQQYKAALPDTSVWHTAGIIVSPYSKYYFRYPAYDNYPVVGISYENALVYCQWLTDVYNKDEKRKFNKVIFRLPSKEEWILAASGGDEKKQYPWGNGFVHNSRGMALCNFDQSPALKYDSTSKTYIKAPDAQGRLWVTSPVKSFYPSSFGIYNMSGNVAEMIAEKGIAKGGSYSDPAWEVTIASEKKYTKPTADIGFRVVMEVLDTP
jgi:sulfatase modifying factor 1